MTSELRPAVDVWRQAHQALYWLPKGTIGEQGAAAVIEADREAVRAPLLAEIERLREALELADAALSGANMNMNVVERKVRAALKGTKCTVSQEA